MAAIINFAEQIQGDTFEQRVFAVKRTSKGVLQDLTGASCVFEVFRSGSDRIWLTQVVDVIDAVNCIIRLKEIKAPELTPHLYKWRIKITYADGDIKTYLGGNMPIVQFNPENSCLKQ
tara:strand:+ start:25128 stop:25481 length:354 start_codon:yes stop_codon:yes gene_type:complete